jgi:hypothetical protein
VIERLNNLREITEAKIAMGEKLNTVREYAAIRGIKIAGGPGAFLFLATHV